MVGVRGAYEGLIEFKGFRVREGGVVLSKGEDFFVKGLVEGFEVHLNYVRWLLNSR